MTYTIPVCVVDGCERPVWVDKSGYCRTHYHRMRRRGETGGPAPERVDGTPEERWLHWTVEQPDGCWIWTGTRDRHGYGILTVVEDGVRRSYPAHRWGYKHFARPVADDMDLDHLCRNRACCNPAHLEPVSHLENVRRGRSGAANREKTHCKHGHEFTPENTKVTTRGGRECRTCLKEQGRLRQQRHRGSDPNWVPYAERTHCPKGHEYTLENTVLNKRGQRSCRECQRVAIREYMRRRRAGLTK